MIVRACAGILLSCLFTFVSPAGHVIEDTIIVPMTRAILPEAGRKLVSEKLPTVWGRLARANP